MINPVDMAQVVISGQNAIKASMDSIDFIIKYSNYFTMKIQMKLVIVAIRIAASLLTTFIYFIIATFALEVRKNYIYISFQLFVRYILWRLPFWYALLPAEWCSPILQVQLMPFSLAISIRRNLWAYLIMQSLK